MMPMSPYDIMKMIERRNAEAERRAQRRRLFEEAVAATRERMPSPISRLLRRASRLLEPACRRLEQGVGPRRLPIGRRVAARSCSYVLRGSR